MLYCTASPFLLFTYFLFPFSFVYLLSLFCSLALSFTPPFFTHSLSSLVRSLFSLPSSLFLSLSFAIFLIWSLIFMFSFPSLSFPGLLALFFFVRSLPSLSLSPVCWFSLLCLLSSFSSSFPRLLARSPSFALSLSLSLPSLLFLVFYKLWDIIFIYY